MIGAALCIAAIILPWMISYLYITWNTNARPFEKHNYLNCFELMYVGLAPIVLFLTCDFIEIFSVSKFSKLSELWVIRCSLLFACIFPITSLYFQLQSHTTVRDPNYLMLTMCAFVSLISSAVTSLPLLINWESSVDINGSDTPDMFAYASRKLICPRTHTIVMNIAAAVYFILRCVSLFAKNKNLSTNLSEIADCCQLFFYFESAVASMTWSTYSYSEIEFNATNGSISLLLATFAVKNAASFILIFSTKSFLRSQSELNSNFIRSELLIHLAYVVVATTIPAKFASTRLFESLVEAIEEKVSFLRYISHEMRTPLNIIELSLGFVESETMSLSPLVGVDKTNLLLDALSDIKESCQNAVSVVNDLLTIDKMQSNKYNLELEKVNISNYLKSSCRQFGLLAEQSEVNFRFVIQSTNPDNKKTVIRMDKHKMSQVLRNLLSNAFKFTPKNGSVVLSYTTKRVDALPMTTNSNFSSRRVAPQPGTSSSPSHNPGYVVVVSVTDSGAGISKENQKHMFGQYVQFNANVLQKGKGSGLGLWISKST